MISMTKKIPVQNHKRMAIQTTVLRTLYMAGIVSVALLAPNMARILPDADGGKKNRQALYRRITLARNLLKQRKLIEEVGGRLSLTEGGRRHIEKILMREYKIPEPVRWDGKWRMLIFDIRESRRQVRFTLRQLLRGIGFVRLQDSVWVYPYPCDEFVALVRAHLASGVGELRSLVVEALESDRALRDHFHLP